MPEQASATVAPISAAVSVPAAAVAGPVAAQVESATNAEAGAVVPAAEAALSAYVAKSTGDVWGDVVKLAKKAI